jgi:hypothetical protein
MSTEVESPGAVLARYLASPLHGWSIGIPGASGEFMFDRDEPVEMHVHDTVFQVRSARGAMHLRLPDTTRCVAYEGLSHCGSTWSQALAFCLPADAAALPPRTTLTEDGPDSGAACSRAREEILFDLGVGSPHARFCVRTGDAALLADLRAGVGYSLLDPHGPLFAKLRAASPTRVILSGMGRIEVQQAIPGRAEATAPGPHTHLMPRLLNGKLQDSVTTVPAGLIAALTLHPQHPLQDKYGETTAFNRKAHEEFQELLRLHGPPEYRAAKSRLLTADAAGGGTLSPQPHSSHHERIARAVTSLQRPYLSTAA